MDSPWRHTAGHAGRLMSARRGLAAMPLACLCPDLPSITGEFHLEAIAMKISLVPDVLVHGIGLSYSVCRPCYDNAGGTRTLHRRDEGAQ